MKQKCHVRISCAGSENEMVHLCTTMLENCDYEMDEDAPPMKLDELYARIHQFSYEEEGEECEFMYGMLAPYTMGEAIPESCRFKITKHGCGLFTCLFQYESPCNFQNDDVLSFHKQCGSMPMIAIYASEDFACEKGTRFFSGGRSYENWDNLQLIWFYLIRGYDVGLPGNEAVEEMTKLQQMLDENESDCNMQELIEMAIENIQRISSVNEPDVQFLHDLRENKDFQGIFELYTHLIEGEIWDSNHSAFFLANLTSLGNIWKKYLQENWNFCRNI